MTGKEAATLASRRALVREQLAASAASCLATAEAAEGEIVRAAARIASAFRSGGRVLAFGNGGSAADAQHFASELAGRLESERPALPALALTTNASDLTAIANDYGFERVFERLLEAHGRPGDVAVAISTSGDSPNVIAGARAARKGGLTTIGLTGRGGGALAGAVDVAIVVPSDSTPRIQESHIAVCHVLCALVEAELFPDGGAS